MDFNIRQTKTNEYYKTEFLTRETFWNLYSSGCTDHFLLHNFRKSENYIEELDLVITGNEEILGHIILTKAKIVCNDHIEHGVLVLGPVSIDPGHQNRGLGTMLVKHAVERARALNFKGIILYGNPAYYRRFGFKNAETFKITTPDGRNFDSFMALELGKNSLIGIEGRFFSVESFEADEQQHAEFEKQFPVKEKGPAKISIHI